MASFVFLGGAQDHFKSRTWPDHIEVRLRGGLKEIYERQNDEPPFVYVQIGYAENEIWK